jgi:hypothetical protein
MDLTIHFRNSDIINFIVSETVDESNSLGTSEISIFSRDNSFRTAEIFVFGPKKFLDVLKLLFSVTI